MLSHESNPCSAYQLTVDEQENLNSDKVCRKSKPFLNKETQQKNDMAERVAETKHCTCEPRQLV